MAKQSVNLGSGTNAGDGDVLRVAFDKTQDNIDEIYTLLGNGTTLSITGDVSMSGGAVTIANDAVENAMLADDAVDSDQIADGSIDEVHLNVTNTPTDGYVLTYDSGSAGFTWEQKFDGDITSIVAGNGLTGDASSGDATLAVGAGTGITVNANDVQISNGGVDTTQMANDAITHDKLSGAYTAAQTITTTSGTINLDASSYAVFRLTSDLTGATTLNIQNMKEGQSIDITVSGSQTITFSSDDTTETFNKVGGTDYDGAEDNHIQVICLEDTDSGAIYNYTIGTYTSDTTP